MQLGQEGELARAVLACSSHKHNDGCVFGHTIRTVKSNEDPDRGRGYFGDWSKAFHNHAPNVETLRSRVPPAMKKEAKYLTVRLRLDYKDI